MKKAFVVFLVLAQLACSHLIHAQSLAGAWVSKHFILVLVNFSITFDADMSYKIDCALGKTLGTFTIEEGKIFFSPTNSGINNPKANDIGSINIYAYEFIDENTLLLRGGRVSITLIRKEMHESKLNEQ